MRHAAPKAHAGLGAMRLTSSLFASPSGAHCAQSVRARQAANGDAVALHINQSLANRLNEVAPLTRKAIRQSAKAAQRKHNVLTSVSLAALVGTAATSMAFMKGEDTSTFADGTSTETTQVHRISDVSASRSDSREMLSDLGAAQTDTATVSTDGKTTTTSNSGDWALGDSNTIAESAKLTKAVANNPKVAELMDKFAPVQPQGFNGNHETGDTGNAYPYGQCTWWAYERRSQLGLNTGSYFGDARSWATSASSMGYWVDNTARNTGDVVVFSPGQEGADGFYGHVAVVEKINADGSIEISESNAKGLGVISHRMFTAEQAKNLQYIHY